MSYCGTSVRSSCPALDYCRLTQRSTGDVMKSAAFITDALLDPTTSLSEDTSASPCLQLFKTKSFFDHLYAPGNEYLAVRFQAAMSHIASAESSTIVPGGFPWETLSEGTMIVDVGGGRGTACQEIMKKNPLLKFTVQDLPSVAEGAIAVSTSTSISTLEPIYQQSARSIGTNLSPRRSEMARSRSKHTIFSLRNQSKTRIYSCSGASSTIGRTQRQSRSSSG